LQCLSSLNPTLKFVDSGVVSIPGQFPWTLSIVYVYNFKIMEITFQRLTLSSTFGKNKMGGRDFSTVAE
jgi:hypothetical protein